MAPVNFNNMMAKIANHVAPFMDRAEQFEAKLDAAVAKGFELIKSRGVDLGGDDATRARGLNASGNRFATNATDYIASTSGVTEKAMKGYVLAQLLQRVKAEDASWENNGRAMSATDRTA